MTKKIVVSEEVVGMLFECNENPAGNLFLFLDEHCNNYDGGTMTEQLKELGLTLTELATVFETGEYEVEKKCPFGVGDLVKWESSYSGRIEILKVHDITGSTMSFTDGLQVEWERSKVTLVCKAKEDRVSMY